MQPTHGCAGWRVRTEGGDDVRYRPFGYYTAGYSHTRFGMGCEDYAACYRDPAGRFLISAVCDGHGDQNCFRSAQGAAFGCESAMEVFSKFFEQYLCQPSGDRDILRRPERYESRLKRSFLLSWNQKVKQDLREHPLTEAELAPLHEPVRACYAAGRLVNNIYGATFLAVGVCQEFFMAMHIGDGMVLAIYPDGTYQPPLQPDPKSETGSPASLCDADLLTRERAFRCTFTDALPLAALVLSDGMEDCVDSIQCREVIRHVLDSFVAQEEPGQPVEQLNRRQTVSLRQCVDFYAAAGHGAEDDCALAGFYCPDRRPPEVTFPLDEIQDMIARVEQLQTTRCQEYAARRTAMEQTVQNQERLLEEKRQALEKRKQMKIPCDQEEQAYHALTQKVQEQKQTLHTIRTNEKRVQEQYAQRLQVLDVYLKRARQHV